MPSHSETKFLPYSPAQMFALVSDVHEYPAFLPWCVGARIRTRESGTINNGTPCEFITADLAVRYKVFRESFSSRVTLNPEDKTIEIEYLDGPFAHLDNKWAFSEAPEGGCRVDFHIDFQFHSRTLGLLIRRKFVDAVSKITGAFEKRAHTLYGSQNITD